MTVKNPDLRKERIASVLPNKKEPYDSCQCLYAEQTCRHSLDQHEFSGCSFESIVFASSMRGCLFMDAVFENCDFSNADFRESVCRRVIFRKCRMTGADFSCSTLQDVQLLGCKADYVNFNASSFKNILLKDNLFMNGAFSACKVKEMEIHACDFSNADFFQTSLQDLDFSEAVIDGFTVDTEHLKGASFNAAQGLAIAELMGIHIK